MEAVTDIEKIYALLNGKKEDTVVSKNITKSIEPEKLSKFDEEFKEEIEPEPYIKKYFHKNYTILKKAKIEPSHTPQKTIKEHLNLAPGLSEEDHETIVKEYLTCLNTTKNLNYIPKNPEILKNVITQKEKEPEKIVKDETKTIAEIAEQITITPEPQKITPEPIPRIQTGALTYPEICDQYKRKLERLPDYLTSRQIEPIIRGLFTIFYKMAIEELEPVIMQKGIDLNKNTRERVQSQFRKGAEVEQDDSMKGLFQQTVKSGYRVRIIKPKYSIARLATDLASVENCWISPGNKRDRDVRKKLRWQKKDIDIGACVMMFSETPKSLKKFSRDVQTRLYLAKTKDDETILFYDAVEGGDTGWNAVKEWTNANRGKELLYSMASAIYVAKKYGIKKIGIGEREIQELAVKFGFKEEVLFDDNNSHARKMGYAGDTCGSGGPYIYMIQRDAARRIIEVDDVVVVGKRKLIGKLDDLENLMSTKKRIKKNPRKMEAISYYLDGISAINQTSGYKSEAINQTIERIRTTYFPKS